MKSIAEIALVSTGEVVPFSQNAIASASATRTALQIPANLSLSDWASLGDALSQAEQSVMWWIGDWWAYGDKQGYGERKRVLGEIRLSGHNPPAFKTCATAAAVSRKFPSAIRMALLSWGHHQAVCGFDDERERQWLLERAQANGWSVAQLRDEVRRYKLELFRRLGKQKYETQTVDDLARLIEQGRRFGTIYADPPWPYDNQGTRAATRNHYKAHNDLTVQDICDLPVPNLAADDAHCHLWATNGFLRDAFTVMDAWGFTYKSCFIWVKPNAGTGNYWRVAHEFMLFGIRGRAPFEDKSQKSWIPEEPGEHSAKPAKVRHIIERCSPGPWLELFGRREVENWTVWGNEIERIAESAPLLGVVAERMSDIDDSR